ncbi:MAG: TIGR00341 family protein [Haloarculaceae archaeon]
MRLVQVSVPAGKRDAVVGVLDDEGVDYIQTEETGRRGYTHVISFPLPTNAVGPVLDRLKEVGVGENAYTVVTEAQSVTSREFDELRERYAEEEKSEERIAREELAATAENLVSNPQTFVVLTVVSAVVATAGLLLNSPATVVGSMVIAPLIGPAMSAAVGTVIDDEDLFARGVRMQVLGMSLAVVAAGAFAFLVQATNLVPPGLDPAGIDQIRERLKPDFLSLAVALGAGVAGALSLTTGVSSALVGVMIAVALVPPAATVGIGAAYGLPAVALPAGILAVVNGLSINLAALVVLWYSGYRPEHVLLRDEARSATVKRVAVLVVGIALLSVFLGGITLDTYRMAQTENDVQAAVDPVFEDGAYAELDLLAVEMETEPRPGTFVLRRPSVVVVRVGVPPGWERRNLASTLRDRVAEAVDRPVPVEVRYVTIERAPASVTVDAPRRVSPRSMHQPAV